MASGPIPSWQIDGETVEILSDFILGGSKITADGDCSHEIKRRLLLGRKVMTNLDIDSILKNRDITLPTKVCVVMPRSPALQADVLTSEPPGTGHMSSQGYGFSSGHVWM